jgi:RimJ/RimL family protein N-acetyltransferase
MDWLGNKLKAEGYEALELNAYKENVASHRLYAREGFEHLGFHFVKSLD